MTPRPGRHGLPRVALSPGATVPAPASGVPLGTGPGGPVTVRLFRPGGTRISVAARALPAQLLVVRALAAGSAVRMLTSRPPLWEPLLRAGDAGLVGDGGVPALPAGPVLVVDDRPVPGRTPVELRPWQCRVDVRTQWTAADLGGLARADLTVLGAVPPEAVRAVAGAFGVPRRLAEQVAQLDAGSFALARRGRLDLVTLDPTPAEAQLLEAARGLGAAPPRVLPASR